MIATPDNLKTRKPLPPVQPDMVDTYVRELEGVEQSSSEFADHAKTWVGDHPRLALGIALGLGVALGIAIKRVRKW